MTKKNNPHTLLRVVLLVAFVAVAIWYSLVIPPGEGVDETPHLHYALYVKEQRALPVQPMSSAEEVKVRMGHHPPLYYVLGAMVISWIDTSDFAQTFRFNPHFVWMENIDSNGWNVMLHFGQEQFPWRGSLLALHVLRLMTVGLGVVALWAVYHAIQLLFPEHPWAPLGATALLGFNPSFVFMSSTVHHDTLQAAIFAVATWWALRFLECTKRKCDVWVGGILVGAALLTKLSGFALAAAIGLALFLRAWRRHDWQSLPRQVVQLGLTVAFIAGWWFVRNQWLYGDPLGWRMFLNIHNHMVRPGSYTWSAFTHEFLGQLGRTFWGAFGYMHITFPEITKYWWWVSGLAGLGLTVGIVRDRSFIRIRWPAWLVVLTILGLLFASFVRFSIATVGAGHGRYLFPAGVSIGALFIAGINGFFNWRYQRLVSVTLVISMLIYAIWLPLNFVLPKYAPPDKASTEELAQAQLLNKPFVAGLELVGYYTDGDRVFPGQWVPVQLYWRAVGEPSERQDPKVLVEMLDKSENVVASHALWPIPSMPPSVWETNVIYVSQAKLGLPQRELPEELFLTITPFLKESQQMHNQRVFLGRLMTTGGITEVKLEDAPLNWQATFTPALRLLGHQTSSDVTRPGDTLAVSLYWEVLEPPAADYSVFIHLLNDKGKLLAQYDRPAGGNMATTSTWQAGQILRDIYPVAVPQDAPVGRYTIRIGMYMWPSMERLPIIVGGKGIENSILELDIVQISH